MNRLIAASITALILIAAVANATEVVRVFVTSTPAGATVSIAVKDIALPKGKTPCLIALPPGPYELVLSKAGYEDKRVHIDLFDAKGIKRLETVKLERPKVSVDILGDHLSGWMVAVDGKPTFDVFGSPARVPCTVKLEKRARSVLLVKDGYRDIGERISLTNEPEQLVRIAKKPQKGVSRNAQTLLLMTYMGPYYKRDTNCTIILEKTRRVVKKTASKSWPIGTWNVDSGKLVLNIFDIFDGKRVWRKPAHLEHTEPGVLSGDTWRLVRLEE